MVTDVTLVPHASQARSRKTRQLILSAAVAVLTESGIEGFTMLAVSERAGVSAGSIYRRFGGKEQLLFATQREFISNFQVEFADKLAGYGDDAHDSPDRRVEYAVQAFVSTFRDNRSAMRVLLLLGLQNADIYHEGSIASIDGGHQFVRFWNLCGPPWLIGILRWHWIWPIALSSRAAPIEPRRGNPRNPTCRSTGTASPPASVPRWAPTFCTRPSETKDKCKSTFTLCTKSHSVDSSWRWRRAERSVL